MNYLVWHYLNGRPEVLGERDDNRDAQKLQRTIADTIPTAISQHGLVLEWRGSSEKAWRLVVASAWAAAGGAPPAPLPTPAEAPTRRLESLRFGRGRPLDEDEDQVDVGDEKPETTTVAPPSKPSKPTRPAATRPPLARRRTTSVAGGTLTATPVDAAAAPIQASIDSPPARCPVPGCQNNAAAASERTDDALRLLCPSHRALAHRHLRAGAADLAAAVALVMSRAGKVGGPRRSAVAPDPRDVTPPAGESAELQQARERATAAERALEQCRDDANVAGVQALREAEAAAAKIAGLQRLLGQVTSERDSHRDRVEADAQRVEQLRGEVEGLTTDLDVARRDLAWVMAQSNELATERGTEHTEKLEALGAEAFAWDLVDLAMTAGLAAATEARAETTEVLRQAAELSRQLGALRDATLALPVASVPAPALLDELMLERIAQRAARKAVALQGDVAKLDRLCREHGGVDRVVQLVEGAIALRKAVG